MSVTGEWIPLLGFHIVLVQATRQSHVPLLLGGSKYKSRGFDLCSQL
jgi:hypothetical protein